MLSLPHVMERLSILLIVLMAIFFQETQSRDFLWHQLKIDCGASKFAVPYGGWELDGEFISTGQNKSVSIAIAPLEMSTLRAFPKGDKNCYKFALYSPNKYLLRAGFYYGNYDGLSKPPIFDITINGEYWTRIYTGSPNDGVQYMEVLYQTKKSRNELCLVRLGDDDVPFISTIEALEMPDNFYRLMTNDSVLYLQSRISFGGKGDVRQESGLEDYDFYNRIWKPQNMPDDYENLTSYRIPLGSAENEPPDRVLANAITPKNNSNSNNSISVSIPIPLSPSPAAYFVLYFKEPFQDGPINHIRKIKIYVDGHEMGVTELPQSYTTSQVVSLYPVVVNGPTVNVTLVEAEGSTVPPILNAMEIFASKEVSNGGYSHYCSYVLLAVFQIFGILMLIV